MSQPNEPQRVEVPHLGVCEYADGFWHFGAPVPANRVMGRFAILLDRIAALEAENAKLLEENERLTLELVELMPPANLSDEFRERVFQRVKETRATLTRRAQETKDERI